MKCTARCGLSLAFLFLLTTALTADEPQREAKPRDGQRPAGDAAPRGERQPGGREAAPRSEFPVDVKLTEFQQTQLTELRTKLSAATTELYKQREAILTDEQKTAAREAEKKIREGGLSRQEIADLKDSALKLTPEQKTKLDAIEQEVRKLHVDADAQKVALLTDEQKTILRKWNATREIERTFSMPGDITLTDDQKAGLKSLQEELGGELAALTEKRNNILTEERKAARDAVYKEAREGNKDRQALADALQAALNMTDAEKAQLIETEQKLGELHQKIRERKLALLTAEQRQEVEKKFGAGRARN